MQIAASVEAHSEHPLARAIVEAAKKEPFGLRDVTDFQSTTGGGVSAQLDGRRVLVGKEKFLADSSVTLSNELKTTSRSPAGTSANNGLGRTRWTLNRSPWHR